MNMRLTIILLLVALFTACSTSHSQETSKISKETLKTPKDLSDLSVAYFASGCFWCVEAVYESVRGVEEAISGYAGGQTDNPTYQAIGTGKTGHAETVAVYYNADVVSFETLVQVFFGSGDPTTYHRQGPDSGSQYRSIAFYQNDTEKAIIKKIIAALTSQRVFDNPIITSISPFEKFYEAEAYHQNYEKLNPNNSYVQSVSIPRLNRFKEKFPELLK